MKDSQYFLPGDIVKKSNALARAQWSSESIWEPRIVALVASKIRNSDVDFSTYEIPLSQILIDKSDGGQNYRILKKAIRNIMGRVIVIKEQDGWASYNLFSMCRYVKSKNCIHVQIHPDLKPHYLGLRDRLVQYTQYNIIEFMNLPSMYSQRLYEILRSWDDKPEITLSIEELHNSLCVPQSFRDVYQNFKSKVLIKACTHINKLTTLKYKWEPVKTGRAVTHIKFIFAKKRQTEAKKKEEIKTIDKNNDVFKKAVECFKSGKCKQTKSKKCAVCIEMELKKDRG